MKPEFIGFEQCRKEFGLSVRELRRYIKIKGCPMLPRRKGQKIRINKARFGEWLDNQSR